MSHNLWHIDVQENNSHFTRKHEDRPILDDWALNLKQIFKLSSEPNLWLIKYL